MAVRCWTVVALLSLGCGMSAAQTPTNDGKSEEPLPETVNGKTLGQWAK